MEQERLPCGAPAPEGPEAERAAFERVWRRVMPEPREDCPFTLYGDEAPAPALPVPEQRPAVPAAMAPAAESTQGQEGRLLQEMIADELRDAQVYQSMARRLKNSGGRTLLRIAEDEKRHARRLRTAYFLGTGVHFWPEGQARGGARGDLPGMLRQRFLAEQQGEAHYRAAAMQTGDTYLRSLFLELAGEEADHAWAIRGILEEM